MKASGVFVRGKVARKQQEKRFPTAAAIARHGSRIHDQADGIAKGKHSPRLSGIIPDAEPSTDEPSRWHASFRLSDRFSRRVR
jgi:hypothetical protein